VRRATNPTRHIGRRRRPSGGKAGKDAPMSAQLLAPQDEYVGLDGRDADAMQVDDGSAVGGGRWT
jgi:hypothetical protein